MDGRSILQRIRNQTFLPVEEMEQVYVAMHPRLMAPLLSSSLGLSSSSSARERACQILDVKYEPGEYFTVLYQVGENLVTGSMRWSDGAPGAAAEPARVSGLGMDLYVFPEEPLLPRLKSVLDPEYLQAALSGLPGYLESGRRLLRCQVTPLRFRPGKRCTIRIDLWEQHGEGAPIRKRPIYGKVYHQLDKARSVYLEMQRLYDLVSSGDTRLVLARPLGLLEDACTVLQEGVGGRPLDEILGKGSPHANPEVEHSLQLAAAGLSQVHHSGLTAGRMRPIAAELERFQQRGKKIQRVNNDLGEQVILAARTLAGWLDLLGTWGGEDIKPVHGDCKPSQFLIQDTAVAILDFDHVGMADPAVDVGTFLATLRQQAFLHHPGGRAAPEQVHAAAQMEQCFLDAYVSAGKEQAPFRLRALWYQAAGLVRKAIRAFERSPYSNLPADLVAASMSLVQTLPAASSASLQGGKGRL